MLPLLLLLALCLRMVFAFFPANPVLFADMHDYHLHACALLRDGGFGPPVRPPLYPFFLAAVYRLAGPSLFAARTVQAFLGACVCLFTWALGMRLGGIRAGNIAGWVTAVYPGLVIYTSLAMSENLFIPLFVVALWLLIRGGQYRGAECLCAGVLIGLGTLTRSVLVAFPLVAALWLQQTNGRKNALWCILGALLIIAPWAMRNAGYHRRFVLIDTFSGYNFLVGNNPRATGRQYLPVTDAPAQPPGAALKDDADVAAEGYREGMKFIARNPACFIVLGARKTGYLYGLEIRELAWGYSKNYFGAVPLGVLIPAAIIVAASFPLLCLCALCGLLLRCPPAGDARNGWGLLLLVIAYFTAAHFITFGESRFHLPLVPLFAILAGRLAWPAPLAPRRWRILVFIILVSLLSLNWVLRLAEDWGRVTTVFRPGGNTAEVEY